MEAAWIIHAVLWVSLQCPITAVGARTHAHQINAIVCDQKATMNACGLGVGAGSIQRDTVIFCMALLKVGRHQLLILLQMLLNRYMN